MHQIWVFTVLLCCMVFKLKAQNIPQQERPQTSAKDSLYSKKKLLPYLGKGYFPTKYFDFDLRYLLKFNQYEGIRTGLGGVTNTTFSKKIRLEGYTVYGFRDKGLKYSLSVGYKVAPKTNTWLTVSYTDDLQESGSSNFLTDKRTFQFFEPRLFNIELFHSHLTKAVAVAHEFSPHLLTELQLSSSYIRPTYNYSFSTTEGPITNFKLTSAQAALRWSPFSTFTKTDAGLTESHVGYPQFSLQYTKSFRNILQGDLNLSKVDFKTVHQMSHREDSYTQAVLVAGLANQNTPLTHMYHAYPNNITKQRLLQRFSVAGINSFETMYFNEFFSDKFSTLQLKHYFRPFNISKRYQPQLVVITRYAIGNMAHPERHNGIVFKTLNKGYTESGFEINKLLFGFGLSFTYRYGAYHLSKLEDNVAFKFTFNITL